MHILVIIMDITLSESYLPITEKFATFEIYKNETEIFKILDFMKYSGEWKAFMKPVSWIGLYYNDSGIIYQNITFKFNILKSLQIILIYKLLIQPVNP